MTDVEQALQTLAERGEWHGRAEGDAELVRVEIRRAARQRGIRVRTGIDAIGRPWAATPDGLPADEPWRGVAEHMREVEPFASIRLAWQDRRETEH